MSESNEKNRHEPGDGLARGPRSRTINVLIVDSSHEARSAISPLVREMECAVHFAQSRDEALRLVMNQPFDAAIINAHLRDGSGFDVLDAVRSHDRTSGVIMTSERATVDLTVESIRRGACDFLDAQHAAHELGERLGAAIERVRADRRRDRKIKRLRTICRRLNEARREVSDQVDELCTDLVVAYQDLASQAGTSALASEFAANIRQELDIESLLRQVLEALLTRTGPTNAAVFLPTGHSDYNLGAYVNQTLDADSADVLLDHLADIVPNEFEQTEGLVPLDPSSERWAWICEEADWLSQSTGVVFSCVHDGDCMAVVMLFRPDDQPFDPPIIEDLSVMRDVIAQQLDRVVRVHHRTLPEMPSKGFDIGPGEDLDDPDEFGDTFGGPNGGMAA